MNQNEKIPKNLHFETFFEVIYKRAFEKRRGKEFVLWEDENSFPALLSKNIVNNEKTVTIGPRTHMKSTLAGAYVLFRILKAKHDLQTYWFHYKKEKARKKVREVIIRAIDASPFLREKLEDLSQGARYKLNVRNPFGAHCEVQPAGLKEATRSIHPDIVIADDILKIKSTSEGASRGTPKEIKQAGKRFKSSLLSGLEEGEGGSEVHLLGTAMAKDDLLHEKMDSSNWVGLEMPAVINPVFNEEKTRIVDCDRLAWPERYDLGFINKKIDDLGPGLKTFKKEWLTELGEAVDAYLNLNKLNSLFGFRPVDKGDIITYVGGHDVGKSANPSHSYIFGIDEDGRMWEDLSRWGWEEDYIDQIDFWRKKFVEYKEAGTPIELAFYDATRGEFEAEEEQGRLPKNFQAYKFSNKRAKEKVAQTLQKRIHQESIFFKTKADNIDREQLKQVDGELNAPEEYGKAHADNFFSASLACYAATKVIKPVSKKGKPDLTPSSLKRKSRWPAMSKRNPGGSKWRF